MFDPDDNDLDNYCKTEVEESLLNCIMEKEILRRGNKTDLKALKSKIIKGFSGAANKSTLHNTG